MSYDLMVFDPTAAPSDREAFMAWFGEQTQWGGSHDYNDPTGTMPALQVWFAEMIKSFPPMNGPFASDDPDDPRVTDDSLGPLVIYAAFAWSQAQAAYDQMKALAETHRVGFFDVSSDEGAIWRPAPDGKLARV